jgi:hypothetical protein
MTKKFAADKISTFKQANLTKKSGKELKIKQTNKFSGN